MALASELPNASHQVERGHDDRDEADDEVVPFLEILSAEAHADEQDLEQIEVGDWCPVGWLGKAT